MVVVGDWVVVVDAMPPEVVDTEPLEMVVEGDWMVIVVVGDWVMVVVAMPPEGMVEGD